MVEGQDWQVWEEHGRMAYLDAHGLLDLPLPNLIGAHQVGNAGIALAALRALGMDEAACTAAVTRAEWPARLQRLRRGPLVEAAGPAELWLDGGHNPAAGARPGRGADPPPAAPAPPRHRHAPHQGRRRLPPPPRRPCARSLHGVTIPGEPATLTAEETVAAARDAGFAATRTPPPPSPTPSPHIAAAAPGGRILDLRLALPRRPGAARERLKPHTRIPHQRSVVR